MSREECADAVVLLDGGSDFLMRGDEHGVGDAAGNDTTGPLSLLLLLMMTMMELITLI